jgi:hypothetical protein
MSGLSKSEPFSSIFHDHGEFKRGPELAELIAESFCVVSNGLARLCFNKLHITSVADEYIISTQQVETELEKISLQKAIGPDGIPNWVLKSAAPLLSGPIYVPSLMPALKKVASRHSGNQQTLSQGQKYLIPNQLIAT